MSKRFNLYIRVQTEVIKINRDQKKITVSNNKTNDTYDESYDFLILSPGANPIVPPIPGIKEPDNLFILHNIPDMDRIKAYIEQKQTKRAVVIGGGFIGVEMAENLFEKGLQVTLVEMANQIMTPIDYEMIAGVQHLIVQKGIELILEDGIDSIEKNGNVIRLKSGKEIEADMIILSIGVQPENKLATEANLELGFRNTIKVNENLQTSDSSIYAIGDAIEVKDYINGTETMVPLAWPANRQVRMVADIVNQEWHTYPGTMGTSIVKVFETTVASTGNNEKTLKRLGIPYEAVHVQYNSHAGYYPGAHPLLIKLLFCKETGKIYGAQCVGRAGVDKRIDVIIVGIFA